MPRAKEKAKEPKQPEAPVWAQNATKKAMTIVWCQTHGWTGNRHGHYFAPGMKRRLNLNDSSYISYEEKRALTQDEKLLDPNRNSRWFELKVAEYRHIQIGVSGIVFPEPEQKEVLPKEEAKPTVKEK